MSAMTTSDSYGDVPHPEFIAPWALPPDELADQAETQLEIERALGELDDKYRLVFILRDVEGLSVRETAEALELTESTVKVRLLRAPPGIARKADEEVRRCRSGFDARPQTFLISCNLCDRRASDS